MRDWWFKNKKTLEDKWRMGNHTHFSKMDQTPNVAPESPRLPYHSHVQQLPCYHLNYLRKPIYKSNS